MNVQLDESALWNHAVEPAGMKTSESGMQLTLPEVCEDMPPPEAKARRPRPHLPVCHIFGPDRIFWYVVDRHDAWGFC